MLMVPVAAAAISTSQYIAWPPELSRKSEKDGIVNASCVTSRMERL